MISRAGANALGAILVLTLSACGSQPAEQEPAAPTVTSTSKAEQSLNVPDDPALRSEVLRSVDTCDLLTVATEDIGQYDTPFPRDMYHPVCTVEESGGNLPSITLVLGETPVGSSVYDDEYRAGSINGLPLFEKHRDDASCVSTASTVPDGSLGVTVRTEDAGEKPCSVGKPVLQDVLTQLRADPPTMNLPEESLRSVDPCGLVDKQTLQRKLGVQEITPELQDLPECLWRSSSEPALQLWFSVGPKPSGKEVDLGHGVTGVREGCVVRWAHRQLSPPELEEYETVTLLRLGEGCTGIVGIARTMVDTLATT